MESLNRKKTVAETRREDMVGYRAERYSGDPEESDFIPEGQEGPLQDFKQETNEIRSLKCTC